MALLDTAAYASPWRRRHPAEKGLLAFGLLGCVLVLPPWPGAGLTGGIAAAALLGPARLSPARLLRAVRGPLAFIAVGALPLLVTVSADGVAWRPGGVGAAAALAGRATAGLLCLLLFAATTPLADVLPRLGRCGVPVAVTEVALATYRMLFLLVDAARTVREAQAARLGFRTLRTGHRSVAGQAGAVFVRAFARARRLEEGLALRGYDGRLHVQIPDQPMSMTFLAGTVTLLGAVLAAAHWSRALL